MTVSIDGKVVSYDKEGKGPAVVLIHGWGDTKQTFKSLVNSLKSSYTVVSLDLLGFGGSDAPKEAFDLEKYAIFVADFLKKIDIAHVYAFVGHSNGGAIAIKGLSSGTLNSEKLVLLASSGVRKTNGRQKKILRIVARTAKYPTKLLPSRIQKKLKKKAYNVIGSDLYVAEHLQDTFRKVVSEDLVLESAMISQKTLLLYGGNDKSTPPEYGRRFKSQIEDSNLVVLEGADHFLHQTHSEEVAKLIKEFLK